MIFKRVLTGIVTLVLIAAVLFLPAVFKGKPTAPLAGPDLSSLEYKEIQFDNGDLRLGGMIFVPEGKGPFPAAVIIHGSGTSRRNSRWYLSVTEHLQENGIAVLLPDKRGSEKSGGSWVGADFETLAGDTLAAIEYVRNQEQFRYSSIGLVGMSQGGWIASVASANAQDISFVVSISGAGVTVKEQLIHEETNNLSHYTWPFVARMLAPLTVKNIMNRDHVKAYAGFDPVPYWKKVHVPVFFAFGENDENVPVNDSIKVLKTDLSISLIKVYPDGGHAIRDMATNQVQDQFLDDLVEFIKQSSKS